MDCLYLYYFYGQQRPNILGILTSILILLRLVSTNLNLIQLFISFAWISFNVFWVTLAEQIGCSKSKLSVCKSLLSGTDIENSL